MLQIYNIHEWVSIKKMKGEGMRIKFNYFWGLLGLLGLLGYVLENQIYYVFFVFLLFSVSVKKKKMEKKV
jgi:hypothetical protein